MIARVFPRKTKATPVDDYAFVGEPGLFIPDDISEIHVSVTFTWDIPLAERLGRIWERYAPVKIGGPAYGDKGETFIPGMYLKKGYVIPPCQSMLVRSVPKREANTAVPIQSNTACQLGYRRISDRFNLKAR